VLFLCFKTLGLSWNKKDHFYKSEHVSIVFIAEIYRNVQKISYFISDT
jgi:hypothetical protein